MLLIKRLNVPKLWTKRNFKTLRCLSYKLDEDNHDKFKNNNENYFNFKYLAAGATVTGLISYYYFNNKRNVLLEGAKVAEENAGRFRNDLPSYTLEEVNKHISEEMGVWVTYRQGVYDITNFIGQHPGGDQIMLAAGSSIEPFWLLYGIHKTAQIFNILEDMRIGNLSEEDASYMMKDMEDPYANDPKRHRVLKPASVKPFNAEPPASLLADNFLTPNEIFYVRNHLPVPEVDPKLYELEVKVEGKEKTKVLTLDEIRKLPKYTVTATVMCAGNRRSEMHKVKEVKGLNWGPSSIGNAEWTGARLVDVLKMMGIDDSVEGFYHVQFEGLDKTTSNESYGASIPFSKAVNKRGDVLLAYEMNGEPLPRDHGFPIRVIVPGTVGARNVKWLGRIIVSKNESDSHWQQFDYKGFCPSADATSIDWSKSPAIQELPVISAICKPLQGETVKVENGYITVKGYAWSGGGKKIIRVDVTADGGKIWHVADFDHQDQSEAPYHWSWTLWTVKIPVQRGIKQVEVWAKAVDSSYNTQPETFENIWNFRGVLSNAYHRIKIKLN